MTRIIIVVIVRAYGKVKNEYKAAYVARIRRSRNTGMLEHKSR